jgi:orotidine-5'-phosphate decarboxylase
MDFTTKLAAAWAKNNSLLCVGLDPDIEKLPAFIKNQDEPFFAFNKAIIDATADSVCAFKPNVAFYEALGTSGIEQLKKTSSYIHETYPDIPVILDAKRADIGNTNDAYVTHIFDYLAMDAVTLHPYLGGEALQPFLARKDKGCIVLCRTSNPGAGELQDLLVDGKPLYEHVARQVAETWNLQGNCQLVVGATYPAEMKAIRQIVGDDMAFLVPGIGAQGGDVEQAVKAGVTSKGDGLIINSARGIIYASNGEDFAEAARAEALKLRDEINKYR